MRSMDLVEMYGNGRGMMVMFGIQVRGVVVGVVDAVAGVGDGVDEERNVAVLKDLGNNVGSSRERRMVTEGM